MSDATVLDHHPADPFCIVQITDTHLFVDRAGALEGVDTRASLLRVIERIRSVGPAPDLVLATGDLAHDPEPEVYRQLQTILESLTVPVCCIPGNHDDPKQMHEWLPSRHILVERSIEAGRWLVVPLSTWVPGSEGGWLSEPALTTLEQALDEHPDRYALICLHHPPVSVGSPWMDAMGLHAPERFLSIVDRYPQVRCVVWGHIHQLFDTLRNGVRLLGTPSTCIQFAPGALRFARDAKPPAYRWLMLNGDGSLETGVEWLER